MNKTIYRQYDSRWGSKPYPRKGSSFSGNGCGCCAITHVLIESEKYKKYTPENVRPYMVKQGFAVYNQGTTWSGIMKTLEHYGYKVTHISSSDPMLKVWKECNKGNRIGVILFSGGAGPDGTVWTTGGHYMAFTNYKVDGDLHKFYMKDSGGRKHDGWYSYERSMKGRFFQAWIVENKDPAKTEPTKDDKDDGKIPVDGEFGKKSIKALEKIFSVSQDGYIGGQSKSLKKYHTGFDSDSINYTGGGSTLVAKMQKYLGISDIDGQLGSSTIKKWQKFLKMSNIDGVWGKSTSKATQKWINSSPKVKVKEVKIVKKNAKKGIDISNYQGKVSVAKFKKVKKSGIKFVILRVGYTGSSSKKPTIDASFENNYKNAIKAGLPVGVYYYSLATNDSKAKEEAEFCIRKLKGKKITYPVYIDIEDSKQINCSKTTLASVCNTFCNAVNKAGYIGGVYASLSWFNGKIGKITAKHTKWVAQYYSKCEYKGSYDMWQYSSSGKVPGLSGRIDMNYCYKDFK